MNANLVSEWFTNNELSSFLAKVKPGDIIEIPDFGFSHYGIYIGDHESNGIAIPSCIIYVTNTVVAAALVVMSSSNSSGSFRNKENIGKPQIQSLNILVCNSTGMKYRINNGNDKEWLAFEPARIIQRAKDAVNIWAYYDIWANNCNHFVNYCRYDKNRSDQSDMWETILKIIETAGIVITMVKKANE